METHLIRAVPELDADRARATRGTPVGETIGCVARPDVVGARVAVVPVRGERIDGARRQTGSVDTGQARTRPSPGRRQTGDLNQMTWKVPEIISYLSGLFTLAAGDLIMSGTPAGVGPVSRGDVLLGHVDGVGELEVKVI